MDASLRIFICGQIAIEHQTELIRETDLPGRQARRLWTYLVLNRRHPVARSELAQAIWGEDMPDAWDSALSAVVSRVRSVLEPIAAAADLSIASHGGCYRLHTLSAVFVDHERARTAIHASDVAMRERDFVLALSEARVAMEIAARGFLHGEDGPWVRGERQLLEDIQIRAMERTIEGELERNNPDLAEQEARLLVGLDPLRESAYRLLMRALAAGGNRAEAALVLADCRATLLEQAGIVPDQETELLFQRLVRAQQSMPNR